MEFDTIEAISKKIKEITKNEDFIFRGENNKNYGKITSSLYREQKKQIDETKEIPNKKEIFNSLYFPSIQKEIIKSAKRHFSNSTSNLEILTEIQHYGGKTNLIDFSKNFLIALFFACDGESKEDGRLICLNKKNYKLVQDIKDEDFEEDLILESNSKNNRIIFQSSIFVYSSNGFIEDKEDRKLEIILIKKRYKEDLLTELKKYHNINTDSIYNDLQGFISNSNNYKTAQTYFYIGNSYFKKGEPKEAIRNYDKSIEINPNNANTYNNRGFEKSKLGNYQEAIKDYNKAIQRNPNHAVSYNNRGNAKSKLGNQEGAIEDYNKALEINPKLAEAYNNRGNAKAELGNYQEAIEDYNKAIKINPKFTEAYNNRGLLQSKLGNHQEGIKDYNKAIRINPNYSEAYNNRGFAKFELGKYQESIKDYDKALEINPNYKKAYYNREIARKMLEENQ